MKGKRRTLAGSITGIVMFLILAGMVLAAVCVLMLDGYRRQTGELQYRISREHLSGIDKRLDALNQDIRNMLYNGEEIKRVTEACEKLQTDERTAVAKEENYRAILDFNGAVRDLKQSFLNMERIYGLSYNFFFYDDRHGYIVEYGEENYVERKAFIKQVEEQCREDRLRYTVDSQWYITNDRLCTIHNSPYGVIGCWIMLEDFAEDIFRTAPEQCTGIEIYVPGTGEVIRYESEKMETLRPHGPQTGRRIIFG